MKIDLEFAELHNPLFLNSTNLQLKLQPEKRAGLKLIYDREEKELLVYYKPPAGEEKMAIVPSSNVSSMTPKTVFHDVEQPVSKAVKLQQPVSKDPVKAHEEHLKSVVKKPQSTAQVGSPTSHVFSEGPGKVRD